MEDAILGTLTFKFEKDSHDTSYHHSGKVQVDASIENKLPISFKYYVNPERSNEQSNYNNIVNGVIDKISKLGEKMGFRKHDENYDKLVTIIHDLSHDVFGNDEEIKVLLLLKDRKLEYREIS